MSRCENKDCTNPAYFIVHLDPRTDTRLCLTCKPDYLRDYVCKKYKCKDIDEWAQKMVDNGQKQWPEYPNWRPLN